MLIMSKALEVPRLPIVLRHSDLHYGSSFGCDGLAAQPSTGCGLPTVNRLSQFVPEPNEGAPRPTDQALISLERTLGMIHQGHGACVR